MGRKQKDADEEEKLETMSQAGAAYSNYRPHAQQAMNAAMQQQLAALQPMNDMLGMMGLPTQGGQGFGGVVTPEMMGVGQTSGAPGMTGPPERSNPAPTGPQPSRSQPRRKSGASRGGAPSASGLMDRKGPVFGKAKGKKKRKLKSNGGGGRGGAPSASGLMDRKGPVFGKAKG